MATIDFHKYQGTGNDFVMIDNRSTAFDMHDLKLIEFLCDRRFGIGADGVILIENAEDSDFEMIYFNPDGSQSLCGNGSRCAVMFANRLGLIQNETTFRAIDGIHQAKIVDEEVHLLMHDVSSFESIGDDFLIDTGSPHYLRFVDRTEDFDVVSEGRKIRYSERFKTNGVNVNFLEHIADNELGIRTYERGVESETLSCGTGCTAAAIAQGLKSGVETVNLQAKGGHLRVTFNKTDNTFTNIYLIGPAKEVYSGQITV